MRTVLGIDIGTQSVKALCYDFEAKQMAAVASAPLELLRDEHGRAEQHPEWWLEALRIALHEIPADIRASVQAVAVSGQQHGLVAIDTDGEPLLPAKLWCDTSTQAEVDEITTAAGGRERCIELCGNPVLTGYTAPKIRWLRNHRPDLYRQMAHVLLPHDYLNYVLTGVPCMEHGDASGTGLLDVRSRGWSRAMLAAVDSERDLLDCLPPFVEAGEVIGTTTDAAAERFGLPVGIPVAAGGGDNMMSAIGTGNVVAGRLTMSLGSSGTLYAHAGQPIVDPKGNIAAFCGSTGGWLPLLCTMNCTLATELIRKPLGIAVEDFDASIERIPAGSAGLLVLPFFNGERTPNLPKAKASVLGLGPHNCTQGHLLRATVEGATLALKFGVDELAGLGLSADEIVLTGGGANSRVWRQIVADVCGLPVTMLEQEEGAAFGAALQALWALQRRSDADVTIRDVTAEHLTRDETRSARPNHENVATYARVYTAYQRAVAQVTPLYTD